MISVHRDTGCVLIRNTTTGAQFYVNDRQAIALQAAIAAALRSAPSDIDHMPEGAQVETRSGHRIGRR